MNRLLLFNSSNDLALAQGTKEYIAPKSVVQMERDLSAIAWWWAEEGDAVLLSAGVDKSRIEAFFAPYKRRVRFINENEKYDTLYDGTECHFRPVPWGWSAATAYRLQRFGVPDSLMPRGEAIERMRALSSREFAAEYIKELLADEATAPLRGSLVGEKMRFIKTLDELRMPERTIFKSPWSSSGRGIFAANSLDEPSIHDKLTGFIARQGGFLADKMYDKRLDFALEYYITENGEALFQGFSLFVAGGNGFYGYNFVASKRELKARIIEAGCDSALLESLIELHGRLLARKLRGCYCGCVGVDMLIALEDGEYKVHPCVEINLRMNIGILALRVFEIAGDRNVALTPTTPDGRFGAVVKDGRLMITARR